MTTLSDELSWRGFVNQTTFDNIEKVNQPRTFYWGVDPSANSMTIGNLAPAMMIRHFINHGHKAVLLIKPDRLNFIGTIIKDRRDDSHATTNSFDFG